VYYINLCLIHVFTDKFLKLKRPTESDAAHQSAGTTNDNSGNETDHDHVVQVNFVSAVDVFTYQYSL
jgi:hypothetical protein